MELYMPMDAAKREDVIVSKDYIHEIKWDGIRGITYVNFEQEQSLRIFTKKGNERTSFYPEFVYLKECLGSKKIVLDGEIVVTDENLKPSFYDVLARERIRNMRSLEKYKNKYPVKYMVFDMLYYNEDITEKPLHYRKQLLKELIAPYENDFLHFSKPFEDGKKLFESMKERNMEGIVSKLITSPYIGGKKHGYWYKTKFIKRMLCVVGGIQWDGGRPNSLLLGINGENGLSFMCKASLGLKQSDLHLLKNYASEISQENSPFDKDSIGELKLNGTAITWTMPLLTCWISFLELTDSGQLRHPKILGFTPMPPNEATGEMLT